VGIATRTVLSIICLNPNKFGSYEEFELRLTRRMISQGIGHIEVFMELPPAVLRNQFEEAGAQIEALSLVGGMTSVCRHAAGSFGSIAPRSSICPFSHFSRH